jgi:hypothetical protein
LLDGFQWVVFQLNVLLTADMIKTALKSLPKSLDKTCDQILLNIDIQKIKPQEYQLQRKKYKWRAHITIPPILPEDQLNQPLNI